MALIICTAEVEDGAAWADRFRTHGELFRSQTITQPVRFHVDGNHVTIAFQPEDAAKFFEIIESEATAEAMGYDGVKRETVKLVQLDQELAL